jgi:hypothetical protein
MNRTLLIASEGAQSLRWSALWPRNPNSKIHGFDEKTLEQPRGNSRHQKAGGNCPFIFLPVHLHATYGGSSESVPHFIFPPCRPPHPCLSSAAAGVSFSSILTSMLSTFGPGRRTALNFSKPQWRELFDRHAHKPRASPQSRSV